jgi:hypothetical protein
VPLKWSRSKERRSLFPKVKDKAESFKERFRNARRSLALAESSTFRNEVNIVSAFDFDPDEELDANDPLAGKAGYRVIVNASGTGFTLEAPDVS